MVPTETTPSLHGEAASTLRSTSYARFSDSDALAADARNAAAIAPSADGLALGYRERESGASRAFVLENSRIPILTLPGAIEAPTEDENESFLTGGVEYTLLDEAFQEPGFVYGFSANRRRSRDASDTVGMSGSVFGGGSFPNPLNEQYAAAFSHDYQDYSVVDGKNIYELTPLYLRPLTEQLNLAVHTYTEYEDASPGNSDPIPCTGIGLTTSLETWAK